MTDEALPEDIVRYQQLVLAYETLDTQIDALLASHQGKLDKMEGADKQRYREMSRQRDELLNEMRVLEQSLFDGDDA